MGDEAALDRLDEFGLQVGLSPMEPINNEHVINQYLNYSPEEIRELTPSQCAQIQVVLSNYGFFLQRMINRLKAKLLRDMSIQQRDVVKERLTSLENLNFPLAKAIDGYKQLQRAKELSQS